MGSRGKGTESENEREQDGGFGEGMERKINERYIFAEGAIMGLGRNVVLGKFPGFHKGDPNQNS